MIERDLAVGDLATASALVLAACLLTHLPPGIALYAATACLAFAWMLSWDRSSGKQHPALFTIIVLLLSMTTLAVALSLGQSVPLNVRVLEAIVVLVVACYALFGSATGSLSLNHPVYALARQLVFTIEVQAKRQSFLARALRPMYASPLLTAIAWYIALPSGIDTGQQSPFSGIGQAMVIGCAAALVGLLCGAGRRNPRKLASEEANWSILFLRTFTVDKARLFLRSRSWFGRLLVPIHIRVRYDDVFVSVSSVGCRPRLLANPYDPVSDNFVRGEFITENDWRDHVARAANDAQAVCIVAGASRGTAWEIREAARSWGKSVLMLADPTPNRRKALSWLTAATRELGAAHDHAELQHINAILTTPPAAPSAAFLHSVATDPSTDLGTMYLRGDRCEVSDIAWALASQIYVVAPDLMSYETISNLPPPALLAVEGNARSGRFYTDRLAALAIGCADAIIAYHRQNDVNLPDDDTTRRMALAAAFAYLVLYATERLVDHREAVLVSATNRIAAGQHWTASTIEAFRSEVRSHMDAAADYPDFKGVASILVERLVLSFEPKGFLQMKNGPASGLSYLRKITELFESSTASLR